MDRYYRTKEFKSLLKSYESACKQGRPAILDPSEYADLANYYLQTGSSAHAMEVINQALSVYPHSEEALLIKARAMLRSQLSPRKALAIASHVSDKTSSDYLFFCAEVELFCKHVDEANMLLEGIYQDMLYGRNSSSDADDDFDEEDDEDDGDEVLEKINCHCLDSAFLFVDYEEFDMANIWLKRCRADNSDDYLELKASVMLGKGNYAGAEQLLQKLIDRDPFSDDWWVMLADCQLKADKVDDSIESCGYALALNPANDKAVLYYGNTLGAKGKYLDALKQYKLYTQHNPADDTGYYMQGVTYLCLNKMDEAARYLHKAEGIKSPHNPNHHEVLVKLVLLYELVGDVQKAIRYLEQVEQADDEPDEEVLMLKINVLLSMGNTAEAARCFKQVEEITDDMPETFFNMAYAYYSHQFYKEAYHVFKSLFSIVDDNWNTGYSYYAKCCEQLHKTDEYQKARLLAQLVNPEEYDVVFGSIKQDNQSNQQQ